MKCPYCAEEIQPDAKKCKHCAEWIVGRPKNDDASSAARAVAKGIKKQKQDESNAGAIGCFGVFVGLLVGFSVGGYAGFWVGFIVFVAIAGAGAWHYHKE